MSADHHGSKGYAPLPQSISNTDTEDEEEHLTQSNEIIHNIDSSTTVVPVRYSYIKECRVSYTIFI